MITPSTYIFADDISYPYAELTTGNTNLQYSYANTQRSEASRFMNLKLSSNYSIKESTISYENDSYIDIFDDYLSILNTENQYNDLIFPGLRYASEGILIFERPPTYKVLDISRDYQANINSHTLQSEYYLPIPWQVYIAMYNPATMRLVAVKMFFTSTSLFDFNQAVFAPPLYNFYSNGMLCRPFFESIDDIEKYPKTYSGVIASAYDWIWNSGFNFDITENISQFLQSKNFYSFEPYLTSASAKASYHLLVNNPIHAILNRLDFIYAKNFYNCWQNIALKDISSVSWSPYTYSDFYYQERDTISDYALDIYLDQTGNSYCSCDCESCLEYSQCCTDEDNLHLSDIHHDPLYIKIVDNLVNKDPKPLQKAYKDSVLFLAKNKISMKSAFKSKSYEVFAKMSEKIQITS